MTDQTLPVSVGPVQHGVFLGGMAHGAQIPTRRQERDGRFVVLGSYLMAVGASHSEGGVHELRTLLLGMAGEAGFGLNIFFLDERVFDHILAGEPANLRHDKRRCDEQEYQSYPSPLPWPSFE
jgi:hypothetical protein